MMIDLNDAFCVKAPDGSDVRILEALPGGSMAHFSLPPGKVSLPVRHKTVEELWFIVAGEGEMWQSPPASSDNKSNGKTTSNIIVLRPGISLSIPVHTAFQFRSTGDEALEAVAVTMPPWPGEDEAEAVIGPWHSDVGQ